MNRSVLLAHPLLLCSLLALLWPATASSETYVIDSAHSYVHFEVDHLGFSTHRGRFNNTSGRIVFDRTGESVSASVVIDALSIDTGHKKLEQVLLGSDWFDAQRYPTIEFNGNVARFEQGRLTEIVGILTVRGMRRPVTLSVTRLHCGRKFGVQPLCGADATTVVKRSDFGMKSLLPSALLSGVSDEVRLLIQVEAHLNESEPDKGGGS